MKSEKTATAAGFYFIGKWKCFRKGKNSAFILMTVLEHCRFASWTLLQLFHSVLFTRLEDPCFLRYPLGILSNVK